MFCTCKVPSKTGGQPEKKEVLLEDHDPIWLELRHAHIADVCPASKLLSSIKQLEYHFVLMISTG